MVRIREGEIIVDSRKVADLVRSHRDLYAALQTIEYLQDVAVEVERAADEARRALLVEPEYDAIPQYVQVDSSWADTLPACVICGREVPWENALLMPCSTVEDSDVDALGIIHRSGCQDRGLS